MATISLIKNATVLHNTYRSLIEIAGKGGCLVSSRDLDTVISQALVLIDLLILENIRQDLSQNISVEADEPPLIIASDSTACETEDQ